MRFTAPTTGFQRAIQRAAIHVQSAGRSEVTGANVLIAIFPERESQAVTFLQEQDVTRYDIVNFISHGIAKNPAFGISQNYWEQTQRAKVKIAAHENTNISIEKYLSRTSARRRPRRRRKETRAAPFVFLSYASADRATVESIRKTLIANGVETWWDQDIAPGANWRETIDQQLEAAAAVLTIWTNTSTASPAVCEEAASAQRRRCLVHARLDESKLPYGFLETQYVDLQTWDGSAAHEGMVRLIEALKVKLEPPERATMHERVLRSSPISAVAHAGKLAC